MKYDREADILYLAHQLWEEANEPLASPQTYWKQAALQVLRRSDRPAAASNISGHRDTAATRHQSHIEPGLALHIDMGTTYANRSVSLIKAEDRSEIANAPMRLVRTGQ